MIVTRILPRAILAALAAGAPLHSAQAQTARVLPNTTPGLDTNPQLRARVEAWNGPFAPFAIIGNIYYVGAAGVSSFLITTPAGHFLLDGGLAETAPRIQENIRALGFDIHDVRYLLSSHAHYDHSGGLAALKAASGARMVASAGDRPVLESGHIEYGPAALIDAAPVHVDRIIADGDTLQLGGVTLTAVMTPGHTRGCTSYRVDVRDASGTLRRVFFHCSSSLGGQTIVPESYRGQVADYRRTFARVAAMRADVFLASHGEFFDLAGRRQRQIAGDANAFVDSTALGAYNAMMKDAFERELAAHSPAHP